MQIFVANLNDNPADPSNISEAKDRCKFCFENGILGISFKDNENSLNTLGKVQPGDCVWLHTNGFYYVAHITGTPTTADESCKEYDIGYYVGCKYHLIGSEIPAQSDFSDSMLPSEPGIKDVPYSKELFDFTEKFISQFEQNPAEKKKSNKKKIIAISLIAFFVIVGGFFSVKGIRYIQNQQAVSSAKEALKGNKYIDRYVSDPTSDTYTFDYRVIEFDEDTNEYREFVLMGSYFNGTLNRMSFLRFSDWQEAKFNIDFFKGDIKLCNNTFDYQPEYDSLTLSGAGYGFMSDELGSTDLSDMYSALLQYKYSDDFADKSEEDKTETEAIIQTIESYDIVDSEKEMAKVFLNKAIESLKEQKIYGYSLVDLLAECTRNVEISYYQYFESAKTCDFTYTCDYAPNKAEMPNYYVSGGTLTISYNIITGNVEISGSAASAANTYAILRSFS